MSGEHEVEEFGAIVQSAAEVFPIINPRLDKLRQALKLHAPDGGLDVERLEIVAEVGVNEFVIVALRQLAQLPIKSLPARIVLAAGAPAIPSPIAKAFEDVLEFDRANDIDRPAFAQRQMVRRVEGLRGQIAKSARQLPVVPAAQRVAIIFDEPQPMLLAELRYRAQIERIAQRVRHENRFR